MVDMLGPWRSPGPQSNSPAAVASVSRSRHGVKREMEFGSRMWRGRARLRRRSALPCRPGDPRSVLDAAAVGMRSRSSALRRAFRVRRRRSLCARFLRRVPCREPPPVSRSSVWPDHALVTFHFPARSIARREISDVARLRQCVCHLAFGRPHSFRCGGVLLAPRARIVGARVATRARAVSERHYQHDAAQDEPAADPFDEL